MYLNDCEKKNQEYVIFETLARRDPFVTKENVAGRLKLGGYECNSLFVVI